MILGLVPLIAAPLTAVASHTFSDVPDSHTFHSDITWLADAGVTKGCNPSANTNYCADDEVTRGQMAAFMKRLAEGRIVDAGQLDGQDPISYTTRVWAESCGVEVVGSSPTLATSCLPSSGGVIPGEVTSEVFSVQVSAPVAGALQLSSTALSLTTISWGFTLDQNCSSDYATHINRAVNGHIWGSDAGFSTAAAFTSNLPAGTHTLRLYGINNALDPTDLLGASLAAQRIAGGAVTVAGGATSPVDASGLFGE
jgi:hypothetical protein